MRLAGILCACLAIFTQGCTSTGRDSTPSISRQQWEALCCRMPQRRPETTVEPAYTCARLCHSEDQLRRNAASLLDSVVSIRTEVPASRFPSRREPRTHEISAVSGGTGVVISPDGLILTNAHVIHNATLVTVVTAGGDMHEVRAVATHPQLDIAVLRIDRRDMRPLPLSHRPAAPGSPVVAISYSANSRWHDIRPGIITGTQKSLQREINPAGVRDYSNLIETTAQLDPGFSGGPMLDAEGRVIGLNVAISRTADNELRGYALPFDDRFREAVQALVRQVSLE